MQSKLYIGNLDSQVDEKLIYELLIQVTPVISIYMPKDKVSHAHSGYAFAQYRDEAEAAYSKQVFEGTKLFGKPLKINWAGSNSSSALAARAEVFIGNLDQLVDEKLLTTTLSTFGQVNSVQVLRDQQGISRGFAFACFATFAMADRAIAEANGQCIMNKPCTMEYAIRDGKRRGDEAERRLEAASMRS